MAETAITRPDSRSNPLTGHSGSDWPAPSAVVDAASPQTNNLLAAELARLICTHPAVRRAVLETVMSCPNIKWEL